MSTPLSDRLHLAAHRELRFDVAPCLCGRGKGLSEPDELGQFCRSDSGPGALAVLSGLVLIGGSTFAIVCFLRWLTR
jgi:hypothetical protein